MKKIREKLSKLTQNQKLLFTMLIGVIGIALIAVSEFNPQTESKKDGTQTTSQNYEVTIEAKLSDIISKIEGVGRTKIMITLESTEETVYAKNEKHDKRSANDNHQDSYSESYVLTKGNDGIVLKTGTPKIRGVIVVCDGAGNVGVKKDIVDAVTSVLSINSNQVSVLKMEKQEEKTE